MAKRIFTLAVSDRLCDCLVDWFDDIENDEMKFPWWSAGGE
jgi:hypothetical protein